MLPYKKPHGRDAFDSLRCYVGVPEEFQNQDLEKIENANFSKLPNLKYLTVGKIVRFLGGKL